MGIDRIMLVFPPMVFPRLQSRQTAIFPMGLAYLAAALEHAAEVRVLDAAMEGYESLADLGNGRSVYGLSDDEMKEVLARFDPQVVGISCLFSTLHKQTLRVARCAKEVNPSVITVAGGPHPSAVPRRMLADGNLDFCVLGEGEATFPALMERLGAGGDLSGLDGIAFRDDRTGAVEVRPPTRFIEDLDALPFPAHHKVDLERYFKIGRIQGLRLDGERRKPLRIVQVTTSRGCPANCTFCGVKATWGRSFRMRSAENVLDEIELLVTRYGVERIFFQDDNLTANRRRAAAIFDGMVERGFNITWEAHNGLQVSTLTGELLEKMKRSGCVGFTAGIESGSPEILRQVRKPVNLKTLPKTIKAAQALGIDVRGFFIIGFPGETREQIQRTCDLARSLRLSVSAFAILTPLPGSALYRDAVARGLLDEDTLDFETLSFGGMNLELSEVPVEELMRVRKIEWLVNVFADERGNLKDPLPIAPEEMLRELENGARLYPDSAEIQTLLTQARAGEAV